MEYCAGSHWPLASVRTIREIRNATDNRNRGFILFTWLQMIVYVALKLIHKTENFAGVIKGAMWRYFSINLLS